jgi:hypothetical protein
MPHASTLHYPEFYLQDQRENHDTQGLTDTPVPAVMNNHNTLAKKNKIPCQPSICIDGYTAKEHCDRTCIDLHNFARGGKAAQANCKLLTCTNKSADMYRVEPLCHANSFGDSRCGVLG